MRKYFSNQHKLKVRQVILLRDKRTGKHKGCAYVELKKIEDVAKAVALSGQPPNFQRFPILVKASEAEKNYVTAKSQTTLTASQMGMGATVNVKEPLLDEKGNRIEAQKVYVGGLSPTITSEQLFALFSPFGQLEKVSMQMDSATGASKGFAFLSFRDPKEANLAIQTMANQSLAGKPIKTGWANQVSSVAGVPVVTSDQFPADAKDRATKAYQVLAQFTLGVDITGQSLPQAMFLTTSAGTTVPYSAVLAAATTKTPYAVVPGIPSAVPTMATASRVPTVAEARASLANSVLASTAVLPPVLMAAQSPIVAAPLPQQNAPVVTEEEAKKVGNADHPTMHILVHNMYDKDTETEPGWEKEIKEEFVEECSKFGKILRVVVMSKEPGGKIYASFDSISGAQSCASSLAGRWFDKRLLRVEFVTEDQLPRNTP